MEDGKETESVDVMHYIWNGSWPENRTPVIENYTLDGKVALDNVTLKEGQEYSALIEMMDHEDDPLTYSWEILPESTDLKDGGDEESRPEAIDGLIISQEGGSVVVKAPGEGAYRLFVYVNDGHNHSAAGNIPFMVK